MGFLEEFGLLENIQAENLCGHSGEIPERTPNGISEGILKGNFGSTSTEILAGVLGGIPAGTPHRISGETPDETSVGTPDGITEGILNEILVLFSLTEFYYDYLSQWLNQCDLYCASLRFSTEQQIFLGSILVIVSRRIGWYQESKFAR